MAAPGRAKQYGKQPKNLNWNRPDQKYRDLVTGKKIPGGFWYPHGKPRPKK